jgi:hypothetical protein
MSESIDIRQLNARIEQQSSFVQQSLGSPVVDINIDEQQIEDRIDEALEYFRLYHYDGIEEIFQGFIDTIFNLLFIDVDINNR